MILSNIHDKNDIILSIINDKCVFLQLKKGENYGKQGFNKGYYR